MVIKKIKNNKILKINWVKLIPIYYFFYLLQLFILILLQKLFCGTRSISLWRKNIYLIYSKKKNTLWRRTTVVTFFVFL